jgi:putative chitobiose transport system substrate-binding protein
MHVKRASAVLLSFTLTAALALTGCAGTPKGPVTIEFWTISLRPFFDSYMLDLIARYEADHPNVKINWVDVQYQALEQKLLAALAGGVPPDVVNLNTELTVRLAMRNALVDMDASVSADLKARYFEGLWKSTAVNGRTYGIPWYVVPSVIALNAEIFRNAGLDPTKPPKSEDEMIAYAKVIRDTLGKSGVYGFMPNVDGIRMLHRFQENGLPILSMDGKTAVFNSPQHVAYLAKYVELYKAGYFPEDALRRGYLGATERYSAGTLAMLTTGPQFLLRVKNDNPAVYHQTLVAPYPKGNGNVLHLAVMTVAVPKSSKHKREAVDFALFLTNDANQLEFSKRVVIFPSTKAAAADPFFSAGGPSPEDMARKIAAQELPYTRDLSVIIPNSDELFRAFKDAIEGAFLGKRTPKEALDWAVGEWNKKLH